jgi:hypothetical protein
MKNASNDLRSLPHISFPGAARFKKRLVRRGLLICGAPRSGTTWLHNALIEVGRYRGIPSDDIRGSGALSILPTDENSCVHRLLMAASRSNASDRLFALATLRAFTTLFYLRFGRGGDYLLKSPYYCYFLKELDLAEIGKRFIYVKRSPDATALSMLKHPHLSHLIEGPLDNYFDMALPEKNLETQHIAPEILKYFRTRYPSLTSYDRALFKYLCFSSSYAANRHGIGKDHWFILNYETFGGSEEQQQIFGNFLELRKEQQQRLVSSFHLPKQRAEPLPAHDEGFRARILEADAAIWCGKSTGLPQSHFHC